jgi:hypothetical protein
MIALQLVRPAFLGTVLLGVVLAETALSASSSHSGDTIWRTLRVGAGGWLTGLDISPDGSTRIVRADTYGAYIWNDSRAQWTQLVTTGSMPARDIGIDNNAGVYEIRVAPNLPTRLYMAYRGSVYRSDDRGDHWSRTAFAAVAMDPNDRFRMLGQKMAVDPVNPDVVYLGTPHNGLFFTTNGGATWQKVGGVPVSIGNGNSDHPGISGIAFEPSSGVSDGKTKSIFAASYGHGIYQSRDGGRSWSAIGGPAGVEYAAVSPTGAYYAVGNDNALWSYESGAWTSLFKDTSGNGVHTVAVNPFNPREIVLQTAGGNLNLSADAGLTWSGTNWKNQFHAEDIPWLAGAGPYMSVGGTLYDPVVPQKLWVSDGVGVWNTTGLSSKNFQWNTPVIWNDQSAGIEQLVANQVVAPPGGKPLLLSWDRPVFRVDDPEVFATSYGPDNQNAIVMGWALDYASSNPAFLVGLFNWQVEKSGYSRDGGRNWVPFAAYPPTVTQGKIGGSIAASTPASIVWAPSNNSSPYYTDDGGASWRPTSIPGVPSGGETGWGSAYYLNRHIVAADRVLGKTFYLYNYLKGLYRSADGGVSWALVHPGEIAPYSGFNAKLQSVPGHPGHLFFTSGPQGRPGDPHPAANHFMRSTDGGATWTAVPKVLEVRAFGFGKPLSAYPTIFISGWVDNKFGVWRSSDNAQSWAKIADFPINSLDNIATVEGDKDVYGTVYVGFSGSGYAYGALER